MRKCVSGLQPMITTIVNVDKAVLTYQVRPSLSF